MSHFLLRLLILSAGGTALALLLVLLRRILSDRLPSAFYYWAWLLVLLRFVLPLPGLVPTAERSSVPAALPAAVELAEPAWQSRTYSRESPSYALPQRESEARFEPVTATEPSGAEAAAAELARPLWPRVLAVLKSPRLWLSVWAIGAAAALLWYGVGYLRFARSLRRTLHAPRATDLAVFNEIYDKRVPRLYRSKAVSTPMLFGLLRPTLVLPDREYDEQMLQSILCHELTHYRRGDLYAKWFAVLVSVVHWFNPIHRLIRAELDRACELACDERLLRHMDANEKQRYGEMLLNLAADRALPRGVVATSFAVEKRNLKERLVQIMNFQKRGRVSLALILAALLILSGCGAVMGPGSAPLTAAAPQVTAAPLSASTLSGEVPPSPEGSEGPVTVSTMDEFLAAIAPNAAIHLVGTTFDETSASDYGEQHLEGYYTWRQTYDGYELVIHDVENLHIIADEPEAVISAQPRYANVLNFENCYNLLLDGFVAGHTQAPGECAGGVLSFSGCDVVLINNTRLYGCGTMGIEAANCRNLSAYDTEIYECSYGAVRATACWNVTLSHCDIHDCGKKESFSAFQLIESNNSEGVALVNCQVHDNIANEIFAASYTDQFYLLGTRVYDNVVNNSVFRLIQYPILVDKCAFTDNKLRGTGFYPEEWVMFCVDLNGEELITFDLERMEWAEAQYDGPVLREPVEVQSTLNAEGMAEYHVSTVDELLSAIGSDRVIYLDAEEYQWDTASGYGTYGGEHYYWTDWYDGPSLTISGVKNMAIIGQGKDKTTVSAVPRYADVFTFDACDNILVQDLTAGHTQEPGSCMGDVLGFQNCRNVEVLGCGLFGCGVIGVDAWNVNGLLVQDTEIYECSQAAANLYGCYNASFVNCNIHDNKNGNNDIVLGECSSVRFDDKLLTNGAHRFNGSVEVVYGDETYAEPYYGPWNTFGPGEDGQLGIYYYEVSVNGGFTTHVDNDEVIPLTARMEGEIVPAEWSVSQDGVLELTPTEDGIQLRGLQAVEGGVMLTATWQDYMISIPVYVLPALGA